ncbi:hypothetical protein [Celeribacter sp.]|uniref:hypothetical protein n=1 Tax=Celeribacter sp. TaxID=1890673 RepID=UPI003A926868
MTNQILRVMPREMRLMSERILSLTALPKGFALMVGDVVMYSEAMGFGGFQLLMDRIDTLLPSDPSILTMKERKNGRFVLDGGGLHAWFAVPSVLDLLEEALGDCDEASVEIVNVMDVEETGIAEGLGARSGLSVEVDGSSIRARKAPPSDPVLDKVMDDGCPIAADLWWSVWAKAQTALTPDSPVSRRHAGVNIVTDDGQIIGRTDNDDDTDASFIASPQVETDRKAISDISHTTESTNP